MFESRIHFTFDKMSFSLDFSHLLFDLIHALSNDLWVKEVLHKVLVHSTCDEWVRASTARTSFQGVLLKSDHFFQLIDLTANIRGSWFGVLVK